MATYPIKRTPDQRSYVTVTVSSGTNGLSDAVDMGGLTPLAIETSTAWTAAGIGFYGSNRSTGSLIEVRNSSDGSRLRLSSNSVQTSTRTLFSLENNRLNGFRFLQLISNDTDGGAVTQGSTRILYLYLGVPQGPIK